MNHSVLHLNFSDNDGGAARSAYKIHTGLQQLGWRSRMLVHQQVTDDPAVGQLRGTGKLLPFADAVSRKLCDRWLSWENWYYPSSAALVHHPWCRSAEVLQFYNLHPHFFSHRQFPALSRAKPIIWRLPDMWAFTGHCTYAYECDRWQTGCGNCPQLSSYPPLNRDTTAFLWREKQRVYRQARLELVVTNAWMAKLVALSPLLSHCPIHRIPNGINADVFYPISPADARAELQLPSDAQVVLFLAALTTERRKGCDYIKPVMERLVARGLDNLVLLIVGQEATTWRSSGNYQVRTLEATHCDRQLATAYAAADVFLHPALVENFPNTLLESLACGTPWVAFDVGGISDLLEKQPTGYLARYQDVEDLADGTYRLLTNHSLRQEMGHLGRSLIEQHYTLERQAQQFVDLYQSVI